MRPLTEVEQQRFAMICDYYTRHGIDPTLLEQRRMFRVSNGVVQNLRAVLFKKGVLRREGRHYLPIIPPKPKRRRKDLS